MLIPTFTVPVEGTFAAEPGEPDDEPDEEPEDPDEEDFTVM
jgi:hypothetical protein